MSPAPHPVSAIVLGDFRPLRLQTAAPREQMPARWDRSIADAARRYTPVLDGMALEPLYCTSPILNGRPS